MLKKNKIELKDTIIYFNLFVQYKLYLNKNVLKYIIFSYNIFKLKIDIKLKESCYIASLTFVDSIVTFLL